MNWSRKKRNQEMRRGGKAGGEDEDLRCCVFVCGKVVIRGQEDVKSNRGAGVTSVSRGRLTLRAVRGH